MEVTDDKGLPKEVRKQLQIEHAAASSYEARLVKLADKICNLRDLAGNAPSDWSLQRRQEYFNWAKAVIDRSQAQWSRKYVLKQKGPLGDSPRKGFFIGVGATKGKRLFEGTCLTIRYFFDAIDVPYDGELLFRGADEAGDIRNHPTALQEAYDAGVRFASA